MSSSVPTAGAVSQTALPVAKPAPISAPISAQAVQAAPVDPLAESPDAVWYVRPTSGGQFGPAASDMMRKWIAEGRVNADSLVWCEGWPEWKTAGPVFPSLSSGPTPPAASVTALPSSTVAPPAPALAAVPTATPAASASMATPSAMPEAASSPGALASTYHLQRRRNSNTIRTAMVVALLIACVLLIVAFLAIMAH